MLFRSPENSAARQSPMYHTVKCGAQHDQERVGPMPQNSMDEAPPHQSSELRTWDVTEQPRSVVLVSTTVTEDPDIMYLQDATEPVRCRGNLASLTLDCSNTLSPHWQTAQPRPVSSAIVEPDATDTSSSSSSPVAQMSNERPLFGSAVGINTTLAFVSCSS